MYTAIRGFMVPLILVLVTVSSGCAYIEKGAYKSAEAAEAYCASNTATGREVVREALRPAAEEKDLAICLRCPGDSKTFCAGDPKTIVQ